MEKKIREKIIKLINQEVVPALGCTEPAAVALCVAKAKEILGELPDKITVRLSGNMLKNAMGVGIPGTGMIGLPIAIAMGAIAGKSEYGLEVLKDINEENLEKGKKYIAEGRIKISHHSEAPSILHIDVTCESENGKNSRAVISDSHCNFVKIEKGEEIIFEKDSVPLYGSNEEKSDLQLDLATIYEFAVTAPFDEIEFILLSKELNRKAAEIALENRYGHSLGHTLRNKGMELFGDSPLAHVLSYTSAACDARMGGASIAVMSNSGSGNQGICATMPLVSYAEDIGASEESLARALILSHLLCIYIKQSLGRLSALCGCVVASTGASAGLVYLMGGGYTEVSYAVKNMIANITGMICDGAKPSCSLKISSGVGTAMMSAMLAMDSKCVTEAEGIICDDVDKSIHNLTSIGRESMQATDRLVLHIMTNK